MTDPFTRRNMKVALLATALFWLLVWAVVAWRVGVAPWALGVYALVLLTYLGIGLLSFSPRPARRIAAALGALALAAAVAVPTFLDTRLLAGGLAVAAAASIDGR